MTTPEHPNTAVGDASYWQLTPRQAVRYHARLSRMWADISIHWADLAVKQSRIATRLGIAGGGLAVLAIVVMVVGEVMSHA